MAQDELPCAVLLAKDVRHSERHRCGLVLAGNLHLRALDRCRKGQVSALDAGEIVDRQPGCAVTETRAGPLIARLHLRPALFMGAPGSHDHDVVAV